MVAVAVGLACVESACAMTIPVNTSACSVVGAGRLDPTVGGEAAICAAVDRAIGGMAKVRSVVVTVATPSRAEATVTLVDGTRLPEVHVASSDGRLRPASFDMLADGIAAQVKGLGE